MEPEHTPQWLRRFVEENFPKHFNPVEESGFSGLTDDWPAGPEQLSFANPAFADAEIWIRKAAREFQKGAASILFVPAVLNSVYFRESVYPFASEVILFTCPIKIPGKNKQIVAQVRFTCNQRSTSS